MSYPQDTYQTRFDYLVALIRGEARFMDDGQPSVMLPKAKHALHLLLIHGDEGERCLADAKEVVGNDFDVLLKRLVEEVIAEESRRLHGNDCHSDAIEDAIFIIGLCKLSGLEPEQFDMMSHTYLYDRIGRELIEACGNVRKMATLIVQRDVVRENPEMARKILEAIYEEHTRVQSGLIYLDY